MPDLSTRTAPTRDDLSAGIPSNLTGTVPSGWDPAYGGVPVIPDPIASAWKALGGDQSMLESIFGLGNQYNAFNYGQHMGQIAGTPSYGNVTDLMAGKLPQDVMAQLNQASAERGTGLGLDPNSPNVNSAYLRALGLSSLDAQKLGQQEFGALSGLFPQAAPFNPSSFFTSPEDIQAAAAAANVSAAAPNPRAAAMEEERKMLEALAAGHSALPPTVAPGGGPSGLLNGPSGSGSGQPTVAASGPSQTINRGGTPTFSPTWWDAFTNPVTFGPQPMTGPLINPSTGASTPFQGPAINQWTGTTSGGFQGPAINNFTGAAQGGFQGPNTDLWSGLFTGGFQGPAINPITGVSTLQPGWDDPGFGYTGGSDWWNATDPWAALSNQDWTSGLDLGNDFYDNGYQSTPSTSDWWNSIDPWAGLSDQDWTAGLDLGSGEDYYGF